MVIARFVWLLAGVAWAARSLLEFAHPDYWDPVTALDWSSVWLYSAAWLLIAPAVVLLGRLAPSRQVMTAATVVAIAAVLTGAANAMEDGLGAEGWGSLYVVGFLTALLGLLPLAVTFQRAAHSRLAWLSAALFLGVALLVQGGGVIVFVALGSLAVMPRRFMESDAPPAPDAAGTQAT